MSQVRELSSPNQERRMSAVLEARDALCAVPFDPGRHSKGTWLREAARLYRISESFAKKIYYGEKKTDGCRHARPHARHPRATDKSGGECASAPGEIQ